MNDSNDVLLTERREHRLTLTLNRPQSANALSPELTEALIDAITTTADIRLCVVRGAGRNFCGGFDLSDLETLSDGDLLWRFLRIETLLQAVHHARFPILALAHGHVIGAGADLFAACWKRVAAPDIKLRMPGWNFELALGTRRLTALIGRDAARDLLIDTRTMSGEECLRCGLATELKQPGEWARYIDELMTRAGALPQQAVADLFDITTRDSRAEDIAAIVRTAGRPGLKKRIEAYRDQVKPRRGE